MKTLTDPRFDRCETNDPASSLASPHAVDTPGPRSHLTLVPSSEQLERLLLAAHPRREGVALALLDRSLLLLRDIHRARAALLRADPQVVHLGRAQDGERARLGSPTSAYDVAEPDPDPRSEEEVECGRTGVGLASGGGLSVGDADSTCTCGEGGRRG